MQLSWIVLWLPALARAVPLEDPLFPLEDPGFPADHAHQVMNQARAPAPVPVSEPIEPIVPAKAPDSGAVTEPVKPEDQNGSPHTEPAQPESAQHGVLKLSSSGSAGVEVDNNAGIIDPKKVPKVVTLAELPKLLLDEYPPGAKSCSHEKAKREKQEEQEISAVLSEREDEKDTGFTMADVKSILLHAQAEMRAPLSVFALGSYSAMSLGFSGLLRTQDDPEGARTNDITLMLRSTTTKDEMQMFKVALTWTAREHPLLAGRASPFKVVRMDQLFDRNTAARIELKSVDPIFNEGGKLQVINAWYHLQTGFIMTMIHEEMVKTKAQPSEQLAEQGRRFVGKAFQKSGNVPMNLANLHYILGTALRKDLSLVNEIIVWSSSSIQHRAVNMYSPAFANDVPAFVNHQKFGSPVPWSHC